MRHPLAIGLGGNLGTDSEILERFRAARITLETALDHDLRASRVYRTEPVGPVREQPPFLNAVLVGPPPDVDPVAMVAALLDIETVLGRTRESVADQGPRVIDLDLLICGDSLVEVAAPTAVVVPHPRLSTRSFVLAPLSELLGGEYIVPGLERSLGALLDELGTEGIEKTDLDL